MAHPSSVRSKLELTNLTLYPGTSSTSWPRVHAYTWKSMCCGTAGLPVRTTADEECVDHKTQAVTRAQPQATHSTQQLQRSQAARHASAVGGSCCHLMPVLQTMTVWR